MMVFLLLSLIILGYLFKNNVKVREKLTDLKVKFMWNGILKSLLVGYLGFATTFIIGL